MAMATVVTLEVVYLDVPGTVVHAESLMQAGEKARHAGVGCNHGNVTFSRRSGGASGA